MKIFSTFVRECSSKNMQEMPQRYKWDSLSEGNFQNFLMHPNVQNDIKLYLNKPIEHNEQSINEATNEIHKIFNKVAKLSSKKKQNIQIQEIKNGLTLTLIKHVKTYARKQSYFQNFPITHLNEVHSSN
jgi:hypothetical protein